MKQKIAAMILATSAALGAGATDTTPADKDNTFKYTDEQFADIQMLRYKVEGFDKLTLKQCHTHGGIISKKGISSPVLLILDTFKHIYVIALGLQGLKHLYWCSDIRINLFGHGDKLIFTLEFTCFCLIRNNHTFTPTY